MNIFIFLDVEMYCVDCILKLLISHKLDAIDLSYLVYGSL